MPNRRQFIKTALSLPAALALDPLWAANDPSRVALVIGNGAYRQSPLANPTNDAAAMGELLNGAGFNTDRRINATRKDLLEAIDRFATAVERSDTRLALFYYAGHGAQLDWRNYLLPVDVDVRSATDLKNQCVDLGVLLGKLGKARNKTFVIILDACRDDPFQGGYRTEQKGLSQFDAPVGSLLAYATSPGNVAADGSGRNGLYTEHLVRELSNRQARIEDAMKRVRLKVRMASDGQQIPWETTSLESDVFIFPEAEKKLSEAETVRLIEADMAEWARIKNSRRIDDWQGYLLAFPNGRFAEIAQTRLAALVAEVKPMPVVSPSATAASTVSPPAGAPATLAIEIASGLPVPMLFQPSQNPNSQGRYPLARKFTVGDEFVVQNYDLLSRRGTEETLRVTAVEPGDARVELNGGAYVWDGMGNIVKSPLMGQSEVPRQYFPAELQVGKKWSAAWKAVTLRGEPTTASVNFRIVGMEIQRLPVGEFNTFVIRFEGWDTLGRRADGTCWVVPGLNLCVRQEIFLKRSNGSIAMADGYHLVSARQQRIDPAFAVPVAGLSRGLVVRAL